MTTILPHSVNARAPSCGSSPVKTKSMSAKSRDLSSDSPSSVRGQISRGEEGGGGEGGEEGEKGEEDEGEGEGGGGGVGEGEEWGEGEGGTNGGKGGPGEEGEEGEEEGHGRWLEAPEPGQTAIWEISLFRSCSSVIPCGYATCTSQERECQNPENARRGGRTGRQTVG